MSGIRGYAPSVLPDTAPSERTNVTQAELETLFRLPLMSVIASCQSSRLFRSDVHMPITQCITDVQANGIFLPVASP
ncbi:hypothetical protein IAD21_02490 [Abditibacteriota bacterium]|nr:hypothetical protein IAD21_02490 [Abditibacteriota bacterium]